MFSINLAFEGRPQRVRAGEQKSFFLSYNANLRHHHQDNLTHRKKSVLQEFLKKNLDNITQDDITKVCQEVRKPVAELTHKTRTKNGFTTISTA